MDIDLILNEIRAALVKVTSGGVTRCETENENVKLKVYKVVDIIRIDIKQK